MSFVFFLLFHSDSRKIQCTLKTCHGINPIFVETERVSLYNMMQSHPLQLTRIFASNVLTCCNVHWEKKPRKKKTAQFTFPFPPVLFYSYCIASKKILHFFISSMQLASLFMYGLQAGIRSPPIISTQRTHIIFIERNSFSSYICLLVA